MLRGVGYLVDRSLKRIGVVGRRFGEARDLADELQGCGLDVFGRGGY